MEEDSLRYDISGYSNICSTILVTISIVIVLILLGIVGTCCHVCFGSDGDNLDMRSTWITERRSHNRLIRRKIYKPKAPSFEMQC